MDMKKLLKHALEEYTSHGKHAKFGKYHKHSKRYKYDDDRRYAYDKRDRRHEYDDDDRHYSYDKHYRRHEYDDDDRYRYAHGKHSHRVSLLSDPRVHSLATTLFQATRRMLSAKGRKY
jgi:hypothetical protein